MQGRAGPASRSPCCSPAPPTALTTGIYLNHYETHRQRLRAGQRRPDHAAGRRHRAGDQRRRHRLREGRPAAGPSSTRRRQRRRSTRPKRSSRRPVREVRTLYVNNAIAQGAGCAAPRPTSQAQSDLARAQDDVARRAPLVPPARSARKSSTTPRRSSPRPRARSRGAVGDRSARSEQLAIEPVADRGHRRSSSTRTCSAPRRGCARRIWRSAASSMPAPVDGYVARRSVQLGQRVQAGAPLMSVVALEPASGSMPTSRKASCADLRIGQPVTLDGRRLRQEGRLPRHGRGPRRRHRRGASRCCRRRTRPATGSRSCSACRCGSRSTRRRSPSTRCASACRWIARVDAQRRRSRSSRARRSGRRRIQTSV